MPSTSEPTSSSLPTDTSVSKATIVTTATTGTKSTNVEGEGDLNASAAGATSTDDGCGQGGGGDDFEEEEDDDDDDTYSIGVVAPLEDDELDFTPPLRIHASRVPERLTGSSSQLHVRENLAQHLKRRKSDPVISMTLGGSRSRSESPYRGGSRGGGSSRGGGGGSGANSMTNQFDGGSSISSLEDAGFDTDILTDKMGVLELDLKTQQEIAQTLNKSLSNLPIVAERGTDEMLEDSHAFTDLKREGTLSRGGSITTGGEVSSNVLEPLTEIDELDETGSASDEQTEKVKITNLEEILEANDDDDEEDGNDLPVSANATFQSG